MTNAGVEPDTAELVGRLREDSDSYKAAMKGYYERALTAEAEVAKLREALRQILRCEYDGVGLNDCIDNAGKPYQSADLAKHIKSAEKLQA